MDEAIIYDDQPPPLGQHWRVTVKAQLTVHGVHGRTQAQGHPAPRTVVQVADRRGVDAAVTAQVQEGHHFAIDVEFQDPQVPAWDEPMHPALRRKLEKQRTVHSTYLQTGRTHVVQSGLDVRVDSGVDARLGWVLPSPRPGVAFMGTLAAFAGWHLLVLTGAPGTFSLEAPAWWGYVDRSPEQAAAGQAQPADGTLVVSVTFQVP